MKRIDVRRLLSHRRGSVRKLATDLGVSPAAVSLALRSKHDKRKHVSTETKQRILSAATDLARQIHIDVFGCKVGEN